MGANDINTSFVEIYCEVSRKLENINLNKLYISLDTDSGGQPGKTISKMSKY